MRGGQKIDAARRLRREATEAERVLWRLLRDRRLSGLKFRRQVPVGPYVADFACPEAGLVVELDGGQHADSVADARRDAFMRRDGWRVLRIWNVDLFANRDGVLWRIAQEAGVEIEPH